MKRLFLLPLLGGIFLASCHKSAPRAEMKTDVDTLSYEIGMANTQGIEAYFRQMGIDSQYVDDFIRGLKDGSLAGDDKKQMAYYAGVQAGLQIKTQMFPTIERQVFGSDTTRMLSLKNFLAGFSAGLHKKSAFKVNGQELTPTLAGQDADKRVKLMASKALEAQYGSQKKAADAYLKQLASRKDIKRLPGGVFYRVIKAGGGAIPSDTSIVEVEYEGRLVDGKVFDSSIERQPGRPVKMSVGTAIEGWKIALTHMPVGSIWEVYVPYDKAYGGQGTGPIPPFANVIFKIQLDGIDTQMASPGR
ncbi:FKBP-type peptidyl-prolyl cis-trans isomerase [Alloprevotella tannerae]|uniref:FKBP-type peptidyl-prolyl cis-trans isomerase n=1 Tax=Alloprevotella tannerae TaxID=76122 RepID=UPI00288A791E|nr:FKBP-type peptidyl-prolyl cis-trans isomerase [Alloprevotella tannerae]